ncbi:hypothetical protein HDU80_001300 [Chytriomyces hyalinus]|nr:hypothetical protein HDU80_001300 [Chytriomyces hyalinus]
MSSDVDGPTGLPEKTEEEMAPPRRTSAINSQMAAETLLRLLCSPSQSPTTRCCETEPETAAETELASVTQDAVVDAGVSEHVRNRDFNAQILLDIAQGDSFGDSPSILATTNPSNTNEPQLNIESNNPDIKSDHHEHTNSADTLPLDWSAVVQVVEAATDHDSDPDEPDTDPALQSRASSSSMHSREISTTSSRKRKYDMRLERPFVCVIGLCRKSYTKKRGLIIHGKMAHPDAQSIESLRRVQPIPVSTVAPVNLQSHAFAVAAYDDDEEDVDIESDLADSDVGGDPASFRFHSGGSKLTASSEGSELVSPSIQISDVDGATKEAITPPVTKKKRVRKLSASDFTSDSGGEGMLSVQMAQDLVARINHLNEQKPFLCSQKGCDKRYRNSNGLKYHLEKHHALSSTEIYSSTQSSGNSSTASLIGTTEALHIRSDSSEAEPQDQSMSPPPPPQQQLPRQQSSPFAHTHDAEELDAPHLIAEGNLSSSDDHQAESSPSPVLEMLEYEGRPFVCPYMGCGKAYKNKNGLLYHLRKGKLTFHAKLDENAKAEEREEVSSSIM